jgi:FixJ family two-component response regulator
VNDDAVVFIVDDDDGVRSALALLLRSAGIAARGFATADEFIRAYDPAACGCLLLDVRLPGTSGLELQERLRERGIDLPVIMVTGHADVPMAVRAMKHGAIDFLQKSFNEQLLLERVQQGLAIDREHRQTLGAARKVQQLYDELSPRERDVMHGIVAGKANKVIAIDLGISERTVEVHRRRVMEKMQVRSVADLVQAALRLQRN